MGPCACAGRLSAWYGHLAREHQRLRRWRCKQKDIYLTTFHMLQENVKAEIANPQHITISYMFLPAVNRSYMGLVAARDQMALVILAHYAIILHRQRHRWWMGENGLRLFGAVKGFLDAEFGALLEWPERFLSEHIETQQLEALLYYS